MSGRRASTAASGSRDPKRGRHKRSSSPETRRWNTDHLIPERPAWMEADTYTKLAELRSQL